MAIIKNNLLVGVLGPLVFKVVNGVQVVSTKKAKGTTKLSAPTIRTSKTYGVASKLSSEIIQSFQSNLNKMQDGTMFSRFLPLVFNGVVSGWNQETKEFEFDKMNFDHLSGFDYNIKSPLLSRTSLDLKVSCSDGKLKVLFERNSNKEAIRFPPEALSCELTTQIVLLRLEDSIKTATIICKSQSIEKYANALKTDSFEFEVPGGCLCLVSTFLHFCSSHRGYAVCINSKTLNPAAISAVLMIPDTAPATNEYSWVSMPELKFE
jgi:hypothetical protein